MDTGKVIGWIVGIVIALFILQAVMPYVVMFLAMCGIYYLCTQNRRD
jgi:hypothetical protein